MILSNVCYANYCLRHPDALLAVIPVAILVILLLRADFVKFKSKKDQAEYEESTKFPKLLMIITRILIFALLAVAFASPYTSEESVVEGDPTLTILVDNSTSFSMFDSSISENLINGLEGRLPTEVRTIGIGESSPLGDALLSNLKGNDNILLVSDGNSNKGRELGDMMLFASMLNSTVNSLDMEPVHSDVRVKIVGPREVIVDSDTEFLLDINKAGEVDYEVSVDVDGQQILKEKNAETKKFKLKLDEGFHRITATATASDFFPQNNVFYKTVKVVPRPRLLYITKKDSPFLKNLQSIYDVKAEDKVPERIEGFSAVVLNNLEAAEIEPRFSTLSDYVSEGNGLVVIGGDKSFARGSYKDNVIESLMPVKVGEGEKRTESKMNIMIVIDISESTGLSAGSSASIDVEKSLAIDILRDIGATHKVGVIAFNHNAFQVSPLGVKSEHPEMVSKIASLRDTGGTLVYAGLRKAVYALQSAQGSKNIIVISDGVTQHPENALEEAREAAKNGIKTYTVSVGDRTNEPFMKALASAGDGIYYRPSEKQNLKILFGDVEEDLDDKKISVTITNSNEFITKNIGVSAMISGYNFVVPKEIAKVLVSTNTGDPLITAWRYGLGNVVAYTTDDGSQWSGSMLSKDNFKLLIRMVNFAVGDPSRTMKSDIDVRDTTVGDPTTVTVTGDKTPSGLDFSKVDNGVYVAQFTSNSTGFHDVMDAVVAVNYPLEYDYVGMNTDMADIVSTVGGSVFDPRDIDRIVETVKKNSRRTTVHTVEYKWPLLIALMVILLTEIAFRKLRELKAWRSGKWQ
ncbi:VWA domain-containing protein [Candidatus Woesearchaeota archaeon]|nr:VWA domain-containing protein [Candidatus Woesearchaeota archaeon]